MLFRLHPDTPQCQVFVGLNATLISFFREAVHTEVFSEELFPGAIGEACWENDKTIEKFSAVWKVLAELPIAERVNLANSIESNQGIRSFFIDRESKLPVINNNELKATLSKLTTHLFERTKGLVDVVAACGGESIQNHFAQFKALNGKVCTACGSELLAQDRANVPEEEQWRADYDHLLGKKKHPLYAVHPDNFVPICHTC